jgi:hypothetical protein
MMAIARALHSDLALDGNFQVRYNGLMARTLLPSGGSSSHKAHTRAKAKRRERPMGAAISLGIGATIGVGIIILIVLLLIPSSTLHNFYVLVRHNASATLPLDPLYQEWAGKIQDEDALYVTTFSLLCGGLVLGRLAPRYAARRRILWVGALMALGIIAVSLGFVWFSAITQQNTMNHNEGGQTVRLTLPPKLILVQALCAVAWTAVCVFGTWLGVTWRDRRSSGHDASGLRPA